jgi:PAS domain S-box-containing protein
VVQQLREELAVEREFKEADNLSLRELEVSRAHYADLYDFAPVGYAALDRQGCLRDINLTGAQLLGRQRAEIVGLPLLPLVASEDRSKWIRHLVTLRRQPHDAVELRLAARDGAAGVLRFHTARFAHEQPDSGRRAVFRTAIVDVTERVAAQRALRESEQRLQGLITSAMDGIISMDEQQRIVLFNPAAEKIFGWTAAQVVGQPLDLLIPARFTDAHRHHVRAFEAAGITGRRMGALGEVSGRRADGAEFPIEASISQMEVSGRKHFTVILRDITERKETEQALARAKEELEERVAQRTSELARAHARLEAEMAGRAALQEQILAAGEGERRRIGQDLHDGLCQLLAGISFKLAPLKARLAQFSEADAAKAAEVAALVARAMDEARNIAHGLDPVASVSEGLMVALRRLAKTARKLFGVACHCHIPEPVLLTEHSAATDLFRIAQEAISNAVKHAKAKRISITLTQDDAGRCLSVTNDGKPFPDRPRTTGMGLKTMRYRAERCGAALDIQRGPRGGAILRCSLQLRSQDHAPATDSLPPFPQIMTRIAERDEIPVAASPRPHRTGRASEPSQLVARTPSQRASSKGGRKEQLAPYRV